MSILRLRLKMFSLPLMLIETNFIAKHLSVYKLFHRQTHQDFDVSKVHLKPCSMKDIYLIKILNVFDFVVCYTKSPFKTLIFKVIQRTKTIKYFQRIKTSICSPPPKFGALYIA